jgi:hypothetical protein
MLIARQQLGKHFPATSANGAIKKPLDAVFFVLSMSYEMLTV